MASGIEFYMKLETLKTLVSVLEKKGDKGIAVTGFTKDEADQWGNNFSTWVKQSKEEQEAKKDRFWVGNGKVFWTDGKAEFVPQRQTKQEQTHVSKNSMDMDDSSELPF